jgi:hypothetical protein
VAELSGLPCPQCGADDWSIVEPGPWERFREWLGGGGLRASRAQSRRCNRCGYTEGLAGVAYIAHRVGWWSVPWRLLRAILDRRSMIPAPYMYLAALLAGLIIGIALDAWVNLLWWLPAFGLPAIVWLIFLASAIGTPGGRNLGMGIRDILNPRGSWERHRKHEEEIFRSCPFRFYGLDSSWTGPRMLGGCRINGANDVASVELIHGDMSPPGAWVRVESAPARDDRIRGLGSAAVELWHSAERPPADLPPQLKGAWMHRRFEESHSRQAKWTKTPINVDGAPIDFDWLQEGADWVARAIVNDLVVKVRGHELPVGVVGLSMVRDVEPYIEGSRRFHEEQRRLHGTWDE